MCGMPLSIMVSSVEWQVGVVEALAIGEKLRRLTGKGEKLDLKADDALLLDRIGDVRAADVLYAAAQVDNALTAAAAMRAVRCASAFLAGFHRIFMSRSSGGSECGWAKTTA